MLPTPKVIYKVHRRSRSSLHIDCNGCNKVQHQLFFEPHLMHIQGKCNGYNQEPIRFLVLMSIRCIFLYYSYKRQYLSPLQHNSMLLSITAERQAILSQIRLFEKLRYKLSNQLRHFKQFHQLKIVIKLTQRHLNQLEALQRYDIKQIKALDVDPYLQSSERIRSHIISKGQRLKQLINDAIFLPFATLAIGCLAKINFNVDKIEKKIQAIARIIKELQKRSLLESKLQA